MPQATDEQRKAWGGEQGVGEDKAIGFLEGRGFILGRDWFWDKPTPEHVVTEEEFGAMAFLVDEWDFGWLRENKPDPTRPRREA